MNLNKISHLLTLLFSLSLVAVVLIVSASYKTKKEKPEAPKEKHSQEIKEYQNKSKLPYQKLNQDTTELGKVAWLRDYEAALSLAEETGKPILILFQEVPGCMNCQRFGREVMSNPLIVDVIEEEFVPLCIFNNNSGADAEILDKFGEPSWNNPVVRIIDKNEKELTKRMAKFHPQEIVNGIADALETHQQDIPTYFQLLQQQTNANYGTVEKAVFPMYCFWSGELKLGQVEGVVNTLPGFMNGREVVEVFYDAEETSYQNVITKAKDMGAIEGAYVETKAQQNTAEDYFMGSKIEDTNEFRLDGEPKYYLSKTLYKNIPMLPLQRIRVNHALYNNKNVEDYLSPSQIALLQDLQNTNSSQLPDYSLSEDLVSDWEDVQARLTGEESTQN